MSDPVTNVEIEDVLSSIRRLVSVDTSRARRKPDAQGQGGAPRKSDNKLVLTDDLRIPPTPELVSAAQLKDLAQDYTQTLERRIAELEAAVTAQANEYEPDGSEDTSQHRPTKVLFQPTEGLANDDTSGLDVLVSEMMEEADSAGDDQEAAKAPSPDATAQKQDRATTAPEEAHVAHGQMWSDESVTVSTARSTPEDTVQVLEAEHHRKEATAKPEQEFVFSSDDKIIDEETLRDMVAEIVRDELQGALGERITRNVRKLVRREIMRAISIRDFE
ncbi:hypothetical protein [Oceaniglobus ichthyenteri]|uniref:hypothetical protein n=1 Tax=Oceaniglobus ichthyenteri TaxID=2136177 RepID=UPI000D3C5A24|nr:hypothetical protein [Oceaniglobus ichthyenteri]